MNAIPHKGQKLAIGEEFIIYFFWLLVQTFVIIILEELHLLPGDMLGVQIDYRYYTFNIDTYTYACIIVGGFYTAVGCLIMILHEVNSRGWWFRMIGWYLLYLPLSFLAFYYEVGWRVADVWFAPVLWVGEIELVWYIQKKKQAETDRLEE